MRPSRAVVASTFVATGAQAAGKTLGDFANRLNGDYYLRVTD